MYSQWPFHLEDCQSRHSPAQWDAFKIPIKLLKQSHPIQSSGLLVLPNELLLEILLHVDSVGQLFLALTCKRLLVVSSMTITMIPSAPKHRAYHLNCSAMLALLQVIQPRDARGRSMKSWAPCCDCYRYRPKRKGYWKGAQKRYPKEMACEILASYDSIVQWWSEKGSSSYQCPSCWCEERVIKYGHLAKQEIVSRRQ